MRVSAGAGEAAFAGIVRGLKVCDVHGEFDALGDDLGSGLFCQIVDV